MLNPAKLSYNTRPKRMSKLTGANVGLYGEYEWTRKFACVTDEVLTFEVSCSSDQDIEGACRYEWWQDKSGSFPGKYSIYHQICKTS
jgi:hypothetical protein